MKIKKPLVLDIAKQRPSSIHIDSIRHVGIRSDLKPSDRIPGGLEDWTTDAERIAERAFKRGYDALVLTNTDDGNPYTIRSTGLEWMKESTLPSFSEYYLIENVDLDHTWDTYRDKIMARAWEGHHAVHIASIDHRDPDKSHMVADEVPARGPWDVDVQAQKAARDDMKARTEETYRSRPGQERDKQRDLDAIENHKLAYRYGYPFDNHPVAHALRISTEAGMDGEAEVPKGYAKEKFMELVDAAAPRKKYIPKIIKMYANGSIKRIEDIDTQARDAFAKYDKLVTQGHIRQDLTVNGMEESEDGTARPSATKTIAHHQLKKMTHLRQIQDVVNHPAYKDVLKEPAPKPKEGEYSIVHDDDDVTVFKPRKHAASVALAHCPHTGKKATWCISSDSESGKQLFDEDGTKNTPYPGAKFIFHPKKPRHEGELHAVVPLANEYRDEHDEEVYYSDSLHRSYNTGIQYEDENGDFRGRYPGFGHGEIIRALYKDAYENPELYANNSGGRALKGDEHAEGFMKYVHSRHPTYDKNMWRSRTQEEIDANKIGNSSVALFNTVPKDPEAYEQALSHHKKVLHMFWGQHEDSHDPEYDDDHH